jgi:hypothetical protein
MDDLHFVACIGLFFVAFYFLYLLGADPQNKTLKEKMAERETQHNTHKTH